MDRFEDRGGEDFANVSHAIDDMAGRYRRLVRTAGSSWRRARLRSMSEIASGVTTTL